MAEAGGMYIPTNLQWRIRSLMNMSKTKIQITPTTPSTVGPNQKIQITLPYSSLLDLSTFSLEFTGETSAGVVEGTDINSVRFPRNTYSLIQEIQIKFNNVVVQHITDYNMIQNILFDIVSNNQDAQGRMQCAGLNVDPSNKVIKEANGSYYALSKFTQIPVAAGINSNRAKDKQTYYIKNFLGILQQGNVNVLDTSMIGQVQITITFASAAVLGYSDIGATNTGTAKPTVSYTLSDIKANMTKINMPTWYYESLRNQLMNGTSYELYFPHYSTFFGQSSQYKTQTTRFTMASDSLNYLLGTFVFANREDTSKVDRFELYPRSKTFGETLINGSVDDTTFNQTRYFRRNGAEITTSQWTIGSEKLPQVPNTIEGCCQSVIEAFNLHQSADLGFYNGCQNIYDFESYFFSDVLSLEHVGDTGGIMLVSGLDSRSLPVSIEWTTKASVTSGKDATAATWLPMIIACETRKVAISSGNSISVN